ncbi:ATP synthase subunit I [Halomonas getboli]|uniref:N-ATPase subunit AtpR n=1 Tax=Halomonas getboli TaxID=2935862 RepID=UPI00200006A4|nr:ATP synthase subunit I [Halomonas getboli]MCK2184157.1 ATP synthase subunit I [Halomonas getboli]
MTTDLLAGLDGPLLAGALLAGVGLGAAFFGGLWWTVRRLPTVNHPAAWLLASLVLRFALVLAGLWWLVTEGGAEAGLAAALGLALARWALVRRLGPRAPTGALRP